MPKILDRYFFREFIKVYLATLSLLIGISIIAKFMERARILLAYEGEDSAYQITVFLLLNVPNFIMIVSPSALLIAVSFTVANLTRYNELTVIQSAGRSFKRTMLPVIIFSVLFSIFSLWFNEHMAFPGYYQSRNHLWKMENIDVAGKRGRHRSNFNVKSGDRYFHMGALDPRNKIGRMLHILELRKDKSVKRILESPEVSIKPNHWLFKKLIITNFDRNGEFLSLKKYKTKELNFFEGVQYFKRTDMNFEEMSVYDVHREMKRKKKTGDAYRKFEVEYYWHLGYPLVSFFIVILGSIFGVQLRKGALAGSIAISICISILYYLIMYFGKSLGNVGSMHPLLAGNFANISFLLICSYLWMRLNK